MATDLDTNCEIHEAASFTVVPPDIDDDERIAFLLLLIALEHDLLTAIERAAGNVIADVTSLSTNGKITINSIALLRPRVDQQMRLLAYSLTDKITSKLDDAARLSRKQFERQAHDEAGIAWAALLLWSPDVVTRVAQSVENFGATGYPVAESIRAATDKAARDIMADLTVASVQDAAVSSMPRRIQARLTETLHTSAKGTAGIELNGAWGETMKILGEESPISVGLLWKLSERHPRKDVCDEYAGRVFEPTAKEIASFPPHVNCLCSLTPVFSGN